MKKKAALFIKITVSLIILFLLLYKIGLKSIYGTFTQFNMVAILLVFLVSPLNFSIGTYNIYILLKPFKLKINFWRLVKYFMLTWAASLILPGRTGDLTLIYFLKKEGLDTGKGTAVLVMDKIITIAVAFVFAVFGLFLFFSKKQTLIVLLGFLLISIIAVFLIFCRIGRYLIKRYILKKWSKKFKGFSATLFDYFKNYKKYLCYNIFITFLKMMTQCFAVLILFYALGINIPFLLIILIRAILIIAIIFPISLNGLGIREGLAVFLFGNINIEPTITISIYLTITIINYLTGFLISLLFLGRKNSPKG